jgi:DUF971 family protein
VEDPKLEASIKQVQELINIWKEYYGLLIAAFDKSKELPADADDRFQRVKNVVAERHNQFSQVITKDHYVASNIIQMVKRTISIYDFEKSSDVAIDKTLIEWHEANILLWETLGHLYHEKDTLEKVSEAEFKKDQQKARRRQQIEKIRGNRELFAIIKYSFIVAVLIGLWYSPIRPWFASIPFVNARINDMRDLFGYEPLPGPGESAEEPAGGEEGE